MKKRDRWNQIINITNTFKQISADELALKCNVSKATIRRDLLEMEENGMIDRYHGGARCKNDVLSEPPMTLKSEINHTSKNIVGRYAASLIKDNQMIYIDAGSATYEMVDYITAKNVTVVTIGIDHISKLISKGINTVVLGGSVRTSTMAITGNKALRAIDDYYFDAVFLGANGIHRLAGISTTNDFEAVVKTKAITRSANTYILVDHTKFNTIYPCTFASFKEVTLITDRLGDIDWVPDGRYIEVEKLL